MKEGQAQLHIAHSYFHEKNYAQARIEYAEVVKGKGYREHDKKEAQTCLVKIKERHK